jgi:hypothetical protein
MRRPNARHFPGIEPKSRFKYYVCNNFVGWTTVYFGDEEDCSGSGAAAVGNGDGVRTGPTREEHGGLAGWGYLDEVHPGGRSLHSSGDSSWRCMLPTWR